MTPWSHKKQQDFSPPNPAAAFPKPKVSTLIFLSKFDEQFLFKNEIEVGL